MSFEYNLDNDTPEGVVNEMKSELNLHESEIIRIKLEIERIVGIIKSKMQI